MLSFNQFIIERKHPEISVEKAQELHNKGHIFKQATLYAVTDPQHGWHKNVHYINYGGSRGKEPVAIFPPGTKFS
jgi:hypothetical protein